MCYLFSLFSTEWIVENTVSIKILGPEFGSNRDTNLLLAIKHPGVPGPRMREMLPSGNSGKANGKLAVEDRGCSPMGS